jgi:hypothetical protein
MSLLQTTGGKDELNIDLCRSRNGSQHRTKNVKMHNRTPQITKKKMLCPINNIIVQVYIYH